MYTCLVLSDKLQVCHLTHRKLHFLIAYLQVGIVVQTINALSVLCWYNVISLKAKSQRENQGEEKQILMTASALKGNFCLSLKSEMWNQ